MEVKHRCHQILELGFPLGGIAKLFAQDWEGDVTVVMPATLAQYSKIIQNPSYMELQKAANQGRRCTWEKLSAIKANCAIELALDECVALLNHMRRLKRNAARAAASHGVATTVKVNPSRRIPSWNRLARENSTGSIEEDFLADAAASIHQMSTQHARFARSAYDGSDSESESIELNCWTRSGGPLMRTASAAKFIQDLEVEPREEEIEGSASTQSSTNSIIVSDGDLLQHERIHNGIVFNVVKKEDLNAASRADNSEQLHGTPPDEVVDSVQMESCNVSVASECGDDDAEAKSRCVDEATYHCNDRVTDESSEALG